MRRRSCGVVVVGLVIAAAIACSWVHPAAADTSSSSKGSTPTSSVAAPTVNPKANAATQTNKTESDATPTPTPTVAPPVQGHAVISYLGQLISWYRHLDIEERLATEPAETLYVADNRQNSNRVLELGFQFAQAAVPLIQESTASANYSQGTTATAPPNGSATPNGEQVATEKLYHSRSESRNAVGQAKSRLQQLQQELAGATEAQRQSLTHQIAIAQAELTLAQSRLDAINAMADFETAADGVGNTPAGLEAQIDQLQMTVWPGGESKSAVSPAAASSAAADNAARTQVTASGIIGQAASLIALTQKQQTLSDTIDFTELVLSATEQMREPLANEIRLINRRALALAANNNSNDLATIKATQQQIEALTQRHKLIVDALVPLSKLAIALNQYVANLQRWRSLVDQRSASELRSLLIRVGGLVFLIVSVVMAAALWRRLTFRYVRDLQRRHQLLQLSRIIVITIIALVLLFDFANELGALATVMGFAAAGIALTLQNVILSLAGYFYVSGRYGIRVGDRVQISGINGDVLEIGLFKMTLMELGSDESGRQPTGRVVVFPNSVVFQPNGNFSKQIPGSTFTWNELRLSLAPDCDYRLIERRLIEVVSEVVTRYRDTIQRETRNLERDLNLRIEPPRPQSHLHLSDTGIELVLRYPVQLKSANQISDEIARRLIDAIGREPALKLVAPGTPAIQLDLGQNSNAPEASGGQPQSSHIEPKPAVDSRGAAIATAAAAGATVAGAFAEAAEAEKIREGVTSPPDASPPKA